MLTLGALLAPSPAANADTLAEVSARGILRCGVNHGLPGFAAADTSGRWQGIDVDLCRAVAAGVLGDANAVTFVPLTAGERFAALTGGEVDVLARNTTWTLTRDAGLAVNFAGVNYFDGQAFMVRVERGIGSARELEGARVCVTRATTTEENLRDWSAARGLRIEAVPFVRLPEMFAAYDAGFCDALTADQSGLAANRARLGDPTRHVILPDIISKEPLGPAVREGDDRWLDVVRWTLFTLIAAEELGVTSRNVHRLRVTATRPRVRRLLGLDDAPAPAPELPGDWAVRVIAAVGNYGESFERNLGAASPINLPRGANALWSEGGLMYAMPVR